MRLHHLFDDPAVKAVVAEAERDAAERFSRLTPRQRQILVMIANGHLNKQSAHALGISVRTLENHRLQLMERVGARSVSQLIRLTILAGE